MPFSFKVFVNFSNQINATKPIIPKINPITPNPSTIVSFQFTFYYSVVTSCLYPDLFLSIYLTPLHIPNQANNAVQPIK